MVDPDERRRAVARAGLGTARPSTTAPTTRRSDAEDAVAARPGDHGADVVFQCRGRSFALATALRVLRPQGTVVDLAFYTGGAEDVQLGEEFHHNGLPSVRPDRSDAAGRRALLGPRPAVAGDGATAAVAAGARCGSTWSPTWSPSRRRPTHGRRRPPERHVLTAVFTVDAEGQ